jgi:signal transduction histidine kinase
MLVDVFVWSCWVNAALSAAMAGVSLFSRPTSRVKTLWGLTCLAIAAWAIGTGVMADSDGIAMATLGQRVCNGAATVLTVLLFHTVSAVLNRTAIRALLVPYVTATFLFVMNGLGRLSTVGPISPFRWYNQRLWPYDIFVAYFYLVFISMALLLWRESRRTSDPLRSRQLRIMMVGVSLGFLGGQTTVPLVYGIHLFPFGVPFVPLYLIIIGYGMLRYHLLDFRFVVRRMAVAGIIYLTIAAVLLPIGWPLFKVVKSTEGVAVMILSLVAGVMISLGPLIYSVLLKKSFWLREHLSMGLTHELRSPVSAIQSAVALLRDRANAGRVDPALLQDYLGIIERNAGRLDRFSSDLLTVAKDPQDHDLEIAQKDLEELVRRAADDHRANAQLKGLRLEVRTCGPLLVRVDWKKIAQVISNVLSNAVRFSDKGVIAVGVARSGDDCRVSVTDPGEGMESHQLLRIFDRFYQVNGKRGGTGLGLAIAKAWVEAHGGRIWAESPGPGKGTTVTFTLPADNRV